MTIPDNHEPILYDLLGVDHNASDAEILIRYRHLRNELDEGRVDVQDPLYQKLNAIYTLLSDSERRRLYDAYLTERSLYRPTKRIDSRTSLADLFLPDEDAEDSSYEDAQTHLSEIDRTTHEDVLVSLNKIADVDSHVIIDVTEQFHPPIQSVQTVQSSYLPPSARSQSITRPDKPKESPVAPSSKSHRKRWRFVLIAGILLIAFMHFTNDSTNSTSSSPFAHTIVTPNSTGVSVCQINPTNESNIVTEEDVVARLEQVGDYLSARGCYMEAITRYTQAIARQPSARVYVELGRAYWGLVSTLDGLDMESDFMSLAFDAMNRAIELTNFMDAYLWRGIFHYEIWHVTGDESHRTQAIADLNTFAELTGFYRSFVTEMLTTLGVQ